MSEPKGVKVIYCEGSNTSCYGEQSEFGAKTDVDEESRVRVNLSEECLEHIAGQWTTIDGFLELSKTSFLHKET